MDFRTQLSGNLREARIALGMTQLDVARRLRFNQSCISQYENGRRLPDIMTMSKLAGIFCKTLDELVPALEADEDIDDNQMKGTW